MNPQAFDYITDFYNQVDWANTFEFEDTLENLHYKHKMVRDWN